MRLREPLHDRYTNDQQKFVTDINRSPKSVRTRYRLIRLPLCFNAYRFNLYRLCAEPNTEQTTEATPESRVPSPEHARPAGTRAKYRDRRGAHRSRTATADTWTRTADTACLSVHRAHHAHSGQHRQRDRQHGRHTFPAGSQSYVLESAARTNRVATLDSLAIDAHSLAVHVIPDHHTWARRL